jgi:beta-D-xylosidase 4
LNVLGVLGNPERGLKLAKHLYISSLGNADSKNLQWLVGFDRLATITPGSSSTFEVPILLSALARVDESGDKVLYPGNYELALNNERSVVVEFEFTGRPVVLEKWPLEQQQLLKSA